MNLTNLSIANPGDICFGKGQYSPECLNKWFCPQIHDYFTKTALILAVAYLGLSWLLWAYWKFVNDRLPWDEWVKDKAVLWALGGNPKEFATKVRIELWIRDKIAKLMVGFLIILWWFYH